MKNRSLRNDYTDTTDNVALEPDSQLTLIPPSLQDVDAYSAIGDHGSRTAFNEAGLCSMSEKKLTKSPVEDQLNSAYPKTNKEALREEHSLGNDGTDATGNEPLKANSQLILIPPSLQDDNLADHNHDSETTSSKADLCSSAEKQLTDEPEGDQTEISNLEPSSRDEENLDGKGGVENGQIEGSANFDVECSSQPMLKPPSVPRPDTFPVRKVYHVREATTNETSLCFDGEIKADYLANEQSKSVPDETRGEENQRTCPWT